MYNVTQSKRTPSEVPEEELEAYGILKKEMIATYYLPWLTSGFVTLQQYLDNIILNEEKQYATNQAKIKAKSCSERVEAHTEDGLADVMVGNYGQFIVFPLIIIFLRMTYGLLIEKEKRIREGMRIMGMRDISFYLSWIIFYMIKYTIISLIVTIILVTVIFSHSNFFVVFLWHWLFCWSLIFQSIFVSTFFTRAKMGNIVAMVFFFLMFICVFLVNNNTVSERDKALFSFSSQLAISFGGDLFTLVEDESMGITFSNLTMKVENYRISTAYLMTLANILIFFVLSFYFDQVIPNEWGLKKHPLFFLDCILKKKAKPQQPQPQ